RVAGVALSRIRLRQDEHAAGSRERDRRAQTGDAATDDHEVERDVRLHRDAILSNAPRMTAVTTPAIDVPTPSRIYKVTIADGALDTIGRVLDEARAPARRFVVSSPLVWRLHGPQLARALGGTEPILVPDGERFKQLSTVARIYDALVRASADRATTLVTFGGGVIGDMAGFAAATYLRGVAV